jgi:hypothetical protein
VAFNSCVARLHWPEADVVVVAICRKPYFKGLNVKIKCIDDVPFEPILAHKVEEKEIAVAEHVRSEHGHANYTTIPPEVTWVSKTEQDLKTNSERSITLAGSRSLPIRGPR